MPRQYATGWNTSTNRPEQGLTPWRDLEPWPNMFDGDGDGGDDDSIQASPPRGSNGVPQTSERLGQVVDANFNRPRDPRRIPPFLRVGSEIKSARNMELYMVHSTEFELNAGDTMVFVDLPSTPKDPRKQADCDGIAYRSQKFRVHSEKLLATGSSKFAEMLRPTYQFRIQRRRKMVNKLPEGVKYLLDLTPPSEGDELVFEMTELSLTAGVMKWWSSSKFHDVDPSLVTGHDDVCGCKRQAAATLELDSDEEFSGSQKVLSKMSVDDLADEMVKSCPDTGTRKPLPPTPDQLIKMKANGDDSIYKTPPFRQIPDYCPVRHRNAIIRLLILVEGRDVLMDSASRVWTLVALAKIFDCPSVVRDRVVQWFMHGANTRFIEILPEEALRIGFALEMPQVTQCAFRILVNEMAFSEAATDGAKRELSRTTVFGRRLGECGDELNNLIQHAARALVERVSLTRAQLQSPDLFDYWNIQEWSKLRRLELLLTKGDDEPICRTALEQLRLLMEALQNAVTSRFNDAAREHINDAHPMLWSMDMDRATYVLPQDFEKLSDILCNANLVQKLLCPFIYNDLGERCSWALYLGLPTMEQTSDRPQYSLLLKEVAKKLQHVACDRPAMVCTDEWAEFLDTVKDCTGSIKYHAVERLIDLDRLDWEVKDALRPLTLSWIRHDVDPPLNITRHMLLTLTINEMKFLPLWAGGFDDGTGGVFESFVPPTDMGPNGPGPAYHTGKTLPSTPPSISESMIEDMSAMRFKGSTTAASIDVHDSISTVYRPDRVIADDVSIASDAFMANTAEYQEARFAVPAEHQGVGQAVDAMVESDMDFESVAADGFDDVERPFSDVSDSEDSVVVV